MQAALRSLVLGALALLVAVPAAAAVDIDPSLLAGMQARAIGPAGMSGRIADVAAIPGDPNTMYVGASTGGLWKSIDGGLTFEPIFDDQPVAAIGAVTIDPSNDDVVWVGTGEGNLRNSVSIGNGIYRSRDAGRTWEYLGLPESERIHRIHVHPRNSDVVYVAVTGKLWGDSQERGVYRTRDGGKNWERVLFVNERTGASDLAIDPSNPLKLIAAMHEFRRTPDFFESGGPGSGLYVTVDGGDTWERITPEDGLPEGDLGRIGVAFAPSAPHLVYAFVEAKKNGFYRSTDGGFTWKRTKAQANFGNRPFYYADVRVDPDHPDRVYSLWSLVSVSDDGGDSFRVLMPWDTAHPDHHAMWIDPTDGRFMINGNDGGVYISTDRGETWRFVSNLPVAQFYHIAVDQETPYNLYGGMQDNGSWKGPSEVWENAGIRNHHWREVSFGDGFDTRPMPDDPTRGYSMSQEGFLYRWDTDTGEVRSIRPAAPDGVERLRFNWNAGLAQDPFDPDVIYYGSQFVHRSDDRGLSWEAISPDLTTNKPEWQRQERSGGLTFDVTGAENFTTIVAIAPSPLERGVIWVGTDDGRVHVTRDGGETWTSVEDRVKGVPKNTWVPHIAPSPHDAGTAFVAFDNHRRSDITPYVYKATEYGRRWQDLSSDQLEGYALVVEQDLVDPELLFAGTEFGLYVSLNGGGDWFRWTHGVPTCSVMDLVVHPREHDLVLGTHGRSAYVLDDIRPLRALDAEVMAKPLHLFEIPPAQQYWVQQTAGERFPAATEFRGENAPYGAMISFVVDGEQLAHPDAEVQEQRREAERASATKSTEESDEGADAKPVKKPTKVEIEILDTDGERVRKFDQDVKLGLNRITWNLRSDPFRSAPTSSEDDDWFGVGTGPEVLPGTYTVVLRFGDEEARGTVEVLADPRVDFTATDRRANWDARQRVGKVQETLAEALQRIVDARADAQDVMDRIERVRREARIEGAEWDDDTDAPMHELAEAVKEFRKGLKELETTIRFDDEVEGIQGGVKPWSEVSTAGWFLASTWDRPSPEAMEHVARAESMAREAIAGVNAFFAEQYPAFRAKVVEATELVRWPEMEPIEMP